MGLLRAGDSRGDGFPFEIASRSYSAIRGVLHIECIMRVYFQAPELLEFCKAITFNGLIEWKDLASGYRRKRLRFVSQFVFHLLMQA